MQSVDQFTPSTTEPVFGSGLMSQTKSQPSTNNDISDNEKIIPPSEPVVNGQNDTTVNKTTSNDNITNGTTESISETNGTADSSAVHVNGQNEEPTVEINNEVKPTEELASTAAEQPKQVEPTVSSTVPEPVSSTPVDTVNEGSSTVDTAPPPAVETTSTTSTVNDNVPDVPVASESGTIELKTRSPRGKAKAPVVLTTPTRQSTRGRKPASSSNVEENQSTDDTGATTTTTNQNETPQRTKRQAATAAKDAIAASTQPSSTSDINIAEDVNNQPVIPPDGNENNDITEGQTEQVTPTAGKKRAAPKSTPNSAKKVKGNNSITPTNNVDNEPVSNEGEPIQTPPKKARTSANKKTPEPPSEEYVRKLRPRK